MSGHRIIFGYIKTDSSSVSMMTALKSTWAQPWLYLHACLMLLINITCPRENCFTTLITQLNSFIQSILSQQRPHCLSSLILAFSSILIYSHHISMSFDSICKGYLNMTTSLRFHCFHYHHLGLSLCHLSLLDKEKLSNSNPIVFIAVLLFNFLQRPIRPFPIQWPAITYKENQLFSMAFQVLHHLALSCLSYSCSSNTQRFFQCLKTLSSLLGTFLPSSSCDQLFLSSLGITSDATP